MQNKFLLLLSLLFGFFITYHFNYTKRSSNSFQEAILVVDQACFHIHHYMWLSVVVACILIGRYMHNDKILFCLIAIAVGSSLEDFLFTDWYIIKGNCHKNRLFNIKSNN